MIKLGIEAVIIGLAIFSIVKIIIFIVLSERFLPKNKSRKNKKDPKTYYLKRGNQKINSAEKYKRDYFR
ncbi:hypothetical protein [Streptococcus porcinus]|uniref:Uncharacterized protein n=1 Tax=Streptococcus porcinus TaxID=1340 RepID=A0A7W0AR01_STRPO|nr:hypothetical protein [Streptococcus porcinus]MBA2795736.1 hypothetical protein [Streptococcus porcinus]